MRPLPLTLAAALVVSGLAATSAPPPARAARQGVARTWWVHRTTPKPIPFSMTVKTSPIDGSGTNEGTLLTLRVMWPPGEPRRIADWAIGGPGRVVTARTYGIDGVPDQPCGAPCDAADSSGLFDATRVSERSAVDSEWFVATYDLDATITVSKGWRVVPIANRLAVTTGDGRGVRSHNVTLEQFHRAELPGGRYGSFAYAVLPCTSAGVGSARFSGGAPYDASMPAGTLTCGSTDTARTAAVATKATTWRLAGDAAGWTSWPQRLVVFSLPWSRP